MAVHRVLLAVVALLALAAAGQLLYWMPQLPARVASHFDLANHVNGWMDRTTFLVLTATLQVLLAAVFIGLPLLIGRLPDTLINLPHKQHWLAPERRAASLAHMNSGVLALGAATLALLLVIFHGVYELNAGLARSEAAGASAAARDGTAAGVATAADAGTAAGAGAAAADGSTLVLPIPAVPLMVLYGLVVAGILVWMLARFRKPA